MNPATPLESRRGRPSDGIRRRKINIMVHESAYQEALKRAQKTPGATAATVFNEVLSPK